MGFLEHHTAEKTILGKKTRLKNLIQIDNVSSQSPYRPKSSANNLPLIMIITGLRYCCTVPNTFSDCVWLVVFSKVDDFLFIIIIFDPL